MIFIKEFDTFMNFRNFIVGIVFIVLLIWQRDYCKGRRGKGIGL